MGLSEIARLEFGLRRFAPLLRFWDGLGRNSTKNPGKRRQAVRRNVIFRILAAVIGLFVLTGTATSQDLYGSIRGMVTDQTGAAVPGVTLTATNSATNVSQHVTSKGDGSYSFLQLAIGDYYVRAAKTDFQ